MSVDKARFRNQLFQIVSYTLKLKQSDLESWKYKGTAKVNGKRMADARMVSNNSR